MSPAPRRVPRVAAGTGVPATLTAGLAGAVTTRRWAVIWKPRDSWLCLPRERCGLDGGVVCRWGARRSFAGIHLQGRGYWLPYAYLFQVGVGHLNQIAAYWDDSSFRQQLT